MNLFCLGLSHHTAAVSLRECFAVGGDQAHAVMRSLRDAAGLEETVLLSTCNRVEVYGVAAEPETAMDAVASALQRRAGRRADFARFTADDVAAHLFRVAAGLDSMVRGETEILGQVKDAYAAAFGAGHTSSSLNRLFQQAFRAAKQVRSETEIGRGAVSVGSAAARLAASDLGNLAACRALLLGAGEAGEDVARSLHARGLMELLVANRTSGRAEALAAALGGRAVEFERWRDHLATADIVIACADSPCRLLCAAELAPFLAAREGRPLFLLDLAVPRDFDPAIRALRGATLHDIDDLEAVARTGESLRAAEVEKAEAIVAAQVSEFVRRCADRPAFAAAA
ncbi:MAG: glutamyl-tRNA reductase [Chthoniobacterales bacterium]